MNRTLHKEGLEGLAQCVGDVGAFVEHLWGRRVHLHRGGLRDNLLSIADVDHLISATALRLPAFRLVKAGATLPTSTYTRRARVGSRDITDVVDPAAVAALFDDGATIVLQGLHRYWPPVTALCRDLEAALTHPVQANAYLTPPGSQGLRVHADAHDVFALQTAGRKEWVLYENGADTDATIALTMVPGDSLYVPLGVAHAARTVAEASLHLTLGVRRITWADAMRPAVTAALSSFGDALPAGFAADPDALRAPLAERLRRLADDIAVADPGELARKTAALGVSRQPVLEGQLLQLLALDEISDESVLVRRRHAAAHLARDDGRATLSLADRQLRFPAAAEAVLRFVLDHPRLAVADLSEFLDGDSRLVLARRLVREGLLTVERRG